DASVDPPFSGGGVTIWGTRYFSAWYWVNVTKLAGWKDPYSCPWMNGGSWAAPGAHFCSMSDDPNTDIPDGLPSSYNSWMQPFCTDVAPQAAAAATRQRQQRQLQQQWPPLTPGPPIFKSQAQRTRTLIGERRRLLLQLPPAPPPPQQQPSGPSLSGLGAGSLACWQVVAQGLCGTDGIRWPSEPHVRPIGGFCAVSCGRCKQGERACQDSVPP
ncbi:hypothetical protein TSOC_014532, partial [Tetrabaena socialis]